MPRVGWFVETAARTAVLQGEHFAFVGSMKEPWYEVM